MAISEAVLRLLVDDRAAKRSISAMERGIEKIGRLSNIVNESFDAVARGAQAVNRALRGPGLLPEPKTPPVSWRQPA